MTGHINVDSVRDLVNDVASEQWDNEAAHMKQDELYVRVLAAIAAGTCDDPAACAAEALKVGDIPFTRWYA